MELTYIMSFISWVLMILMLTGFHLVVVTERDRDNEYLSEEDRHNSDAFFQMYNNANFAGKVNFLVLHGARCWALVFGSLIKKKGD
ncbi:hypothetical protein [Bacillus phage vB_BanS-Thrax5]|nr:hypothetical protein [Bacillus phage vB_BanS-Thrax5]